MGETEVRTADASGQVTTQSAQASTPKGQASKKSSSGGAKRAASAPKAKFNERGVPVTNWDNPDNDPNKRKHVGETGPSGEGNKLGKVPE